MIINWETISQFNQEIWILNFLFGMWNLAHMSNIRNRTSINRSFYKNLDSDSLYTSLFVT